MPGKANGSKQESKNKNKQANKPTACGSTQRKRENREEQKKLGHLEIRKIQQ